MQMKDLSVCYFRLEKNHLDFDFSEGETSLLLAFRVNLFYCRKSRFSRHGLILTTTTKSQLTNKSKISTASHQRIQETNINTTTIDILEKSSSHCSLIETSLNKRLDKYLKKDQISSQTKKNLNKLQRITDDVKFLTKQLQLSNNSSSITLGKCNRFVLLLLKIIRILKMNVYLVKYVINLNDEFYL
jgi:hypothetical protein